ncbi:MAG: diadenylate cyclase [Schleiferiaceae bacterium]
MGALNFGVIQALDIIITAFLLYQIYRLLKGTAAIRILLGMVAIYLLYLLVQFLEMKLLSELLGSFMGAGLIILIIVFQQEIRKFLLVVGSATFTRRKGIKNLLKYGTTNDASKLNVDAMVSAMVELAATKTGALLVIKRTDPLGSFASSGSPMNADLSKILLESIFFKNAPLHDGATIVEGGTIIAAGTVLPLSERSELPARFGLRHRAAAGISERTDALAVTVSEETGNIHIFYDGDFEKVQKEDLTVRLAKLLQNK